MKVTILEGLTSALLLRCLQLTLAKPDFGAHALRQSFHKPKHQHALWPRQWRIVERVNGSNEVRANDRAYHKAKTP